MPICSARQRVRMALVAQDVSKFQIFEPGRAHMPIKDILLPLVGQPDGNAIAAIEKCVAVAGDLGARVEAIAVEQ